MSKAQVNKQDAINLAPHEIGALARFIRANAEDRTFMTSRSLPLLARLEERRLVEVRRYPGCIPLVRLRKLGREHLERVSARSSEASVLSLYSEVCADELQEDVRQAIRAIYWSRSDSPHARSMYPHAVTPKLKYINILPLERFGALPGRLIELLRIVAQAKPELIVLAFAGLMGNDLRGTVETATAILDYALPERLDLSVAPLLLDSTLPVPTDVRVFWKLVLAERRLRSLLTKRECREAA